MLAGVLAAVSPANTPHGYNLTFAIPMLMFIVIAGALYLIVRSPHRVPGHAPIVPATTSASRSAAPGAGQAVLAGEATPQDLAAGPDGRNEQIGTAGSAETGE